MTFSQWKERPIEARTLFNPMFCAFVLGSAIEAYNKEDNAGMPLPVLFLVLPLVLHSKTRSILPKTKASSLGLWSQEYESELLMLAKRANSLNKTTLQSLSLLQLNGCVEFVSQKIKTQKKMGGVSSYINLSDEIKDIHSKSQFIGRWFANSGDAASIYSYLGVRP